MDAAPCKIRNFPLRGKRLPLTAPVFTTTLADRAPDLTGKVRDIYDFGDRLLIVATDRISAFDYVLTSAIPDKGNVLTQISTFWLGRTGGIAPNHLITTNPSALPAQAHCDASVLAVRSMLVTT